MLYLRCEDEPPYGEAPDDTNGLRHPWWRRWLDKGRRLFRRQALSVVTPHALVYLKCGGVTHPYCYDENSISVQSSWYGLLA